jgi:1,4-alpha-glucan branching enzyme
MLAPEGEYEGVMDSDSPRYGGYGNIDETVTHVTQHDELYHDSHLGWLKLYLPARSAQILRLRPAKKAAAKKPTAAKKPAAKKATTKTKK